ncbi:MAG: sensor histidine kinase [Actinomycetota bacterium]|nr:sensor histidine kinase [Actinomycetota bacterium]
MIARRGDPALAAVVVGIGLFEIWVAPITPPGYSGPAVIATAGVLALGAAIVWRRRIPWLSLGVVVAVLTVQWAYARGAEQLPNAAFIAILALAYTTGAHEERSRGLLAILVAASVFLVQDGVDLEAGYSSVRQDFGFYILVCLAWVAGLGIRALRGRAEQLERLTVQLEHEREQSARLAALEERTRLARELHDVVAHGVAVMVLHAGAARKLVDAEPERARSTLQSAEQSGRQALAELRRLLGVLRDESASAELRPPDSLRDLEDLVKALADGGLDVELVVEGRPRELAPGLDLSAYRIVQEALTNTLKHAHAQHATVRVRYAPQQLELDIADDGHGAPNANDDAGHGLTGLRERAALYGGELHTGPGPGGGFRVYATLPFEAART